MSLSSPSFAAGEKIERLDFRGINCADPRVSELIITSAKRMKFENGRLFGSVVSNMKVTSAETVTATRSVLTCRIRMRMVFFGSGHSYRGLFTVRQFGSGRLESTQAGGL